MQECNGKTTDYIKYIRGMVGHNKIILCAACCIICDGGRRVLLQQRADSGLWGLPGGMMELGESMDETAVREVREETGLEVQVDEFFGIYSKYFAEYRNGDVAQPIVAAFTAHITGGEIKCDGSETADLGYFPLDSLPEIFCGQHRDILADFAEGRKGAYR